MYCDCGNSLCTKCELLCSSCKMIKICTKQHTNFLSRNEYFCFTN